MIVQQIRFWCIMEQPAKNRVPESDVPAAKEIESYTLSQECATFIMICSQVLSDIADLTFLPISKCSTIILPI